MKLMEILNSNPILSQHTDKNTTHDYISGFYEKYFEQYKNKKINLLEIGICTGASIIMWSKYFSKGHIYGIDHERSINKDLDLNLDNVTLIFEDAYKQESMDKLPNFDIIIDDGPHTLDSMIYAVKNISSKLNSNGMFVIEDVQDISWINILASHTPKNFGFNYFDLRQNKNRYDDLMFVMKRFD